MVAVQVFMGSVGSSPQVMPLRCTMACVRSFAFAASNDHFDGPFIKLRTSFGPHPVVHVELLQQLQFVVYAVRIVFLVVLQRPNLLPS